MFQQKDKPDETKYVDIINENSSRPKTIIFLFSQSLLNNSNYTFLYKGQIDALKDFLSNDEALGSYYEELRDTIEYAACQNIEYHRRRGNFDHLINLHGKEFFAVSNLYG